MASEECKSELGSSGIIVHKEHRCIVKGALCLSWKVVKQCNIIILTVTKANTKFRVFLSV